MEVEEPPGSLGMEVTMETAPTEAVQSMVARRSNRKSRLKSLHSLHRFIGRGSHLTVLARDRRYFRIEFIEKLRRVMSGQAV